MINFFFTPDKPGVPIGTTSSEPATYDILHLVGAFTLPRVPCTIEKRGVGQTIAAAQTLTVAHTGPPGDYRFRLPALRQPCVPPLGFENKFSPPFEFETGARIEPPVPGS